MAERIGISVTHMSHIETGNTKLSLSVFVDISNALDVQTDDLLDGHIAERQANLGELNELMEGCSLKQIRIITEVAKATKASLKKYEEI